MDDLQQSFTELKQAITKYQAIVDHLDNVWQEKVRWLSLYEIINAFNILFNEFQTESIIAKIEIDMIDYEQHLTKKNTQVLLVVNIKKIIDIEQRPPDLV